MWTFSTSDILFIQYQFWTIWGKGRCNSVYIILVYIMKKGLKYATKSQEEHDCISHNPQSLPQSASAPAPFSPLHLTLIKQSQQFIKPAFWPTKICFPQCHRLSASNYKAKHLHAHLRPVRALIMMQRNKWIWMYWKDIAPMIILILDFVCYFLD